MLATLSSAFSSAWLHFDLNMFWFGNTQRLSFVEFMVLIKLTCD